jgi:dynein heavy chain
MREEWKGIAFDLVEYKDSGVNTLTGIQPIWDMLDEHIQKTMLIRSSPYVKFLIGEVNAWKKQLVDVQDVLEEWSKAQRGWCYL